MILNIKFSGKIIYWHGPAPFFFVAVPEKEGIEIKDISRLATYGWGVIPAYVHIGQTDYKTSLFPKNGTYLVPIKTIVRNAENLTEGDEVSIELEIRF